MKKMLDFLNSKFKLLALCLAGAYVLFTLLQLTSGFGGDASDVFASIFSVVVLALVYGSFIVALVLNKIEVCKFLGMVMVVVYTFNALNSFAGAFSNLDSNAAGEWNTYNVFVSILLAVLGLMFVFFTVGKFFPKFKILQQINLFLGLGALALSLLTFIFAMVLSGKYQYPWQTVMGFIADYLIYIPLLFLIFFTQFFELAPKAEKPAPVEEAPAEEPAPEKEEAPVEEQTDDVPIEDPEEK